MSKDLEFLGKLQDLCKDYQFWIVPQIDSYDVLSLVLSDSKDDSVFLEDLIYFSDLPF